MKLNIDFALKTHFPVLIYCFKAFTDVMNESQGGPCSCAPEHCLFKVNWAANTLDRPDTDFLVEEHISFWDHLLPKKDIIKRKMPMHLFKERIIETINPDEPYGLMELHLTYILHN